MKYTFTGKNIKITEGIKEAVEKKLSKLDKYFQSETVAKVVCGTDAGLHKLEVTVCYNKRMIRSEAVTDDLYVAIDPVVDDLERKIRKFKTKLEQKHKGASIKHIPVEATETSNEPKIAKEKTYPTKPMHPEDACLEMELIGHDFFVFINAETDKVNVVYKRNKGDYGLISPEE